jgi:DNA polymerase elongation subunit (family B)
VFDETFIFFVVVLVMRFYATHVCTRFFKPGVRQLWMFGKGVDGESMSVQVTRYRPYVYIRPRTNTDFCGFTWKESMNETLGRNNRQPDVIQECTPIMKHRAVGFSKEDDQLYQVVFSSVNFPTKRVLLAISSTSVDVFHDDWTIQSLFMYDCGIRLFHWYELDDTLLVERKDRKCTDCLREYTIDYMGIGQYTGPPNQVPSRRVLCIHLDVSDNEYTWSSVLYDTHRVSTLVSPGDIQNIHQCVTREHGTYDLKGLGEKWLVYSRTHLVDLIIYSDVTCTLEKLYIGRFNSPNMYVKQAGRTCLDLACILSKAMISPPLSGFTLSDAVHHKKLFQQKWLSQHEHDKPLQMLLLEIQNKFLLGYQEIAAASFTPLYDTVHRGQQVRVWNKLRQKYTEHNFYVNKFSHPIVIRKERAMTDFPLPSDSSNYEASHRVSSVQLKRSDYSGGLVQEPLLGYHDTPIGTLDFASLYPSIMEGYGICHCKLSFDIKDVDDPTLRIQLVPLSPTDALVLITHYLNDNGQWQKSKSIIPETIHEVVQERKSVRRLMKSETPGTLTWDMLQARQLGCKVFQNSMYGFFGADSKYGIMPIPVLMGAVCAIGQYMIMQVAYRVETEYKGTVVYGDTDSVMITVPLDHTYEDCGAELQAYYTKFHTIATELSRMFPNPNELEFECLKIPFIITGKKNYMALEYPPCENGWTETPKVCIKGFGFMKRDRCDLVHKIGYSLVDHLLHGRLDLIPRTMSQQLQEALDTKNEFYYDNFAITCNLRPLSEYKNKSLIQVNVAESITARTNRDIKPGTRISYVVVQGKQPLHKRGVELEYAKQHRLPLDLVYYIEKQLRLAIKPLIKYAPDLQQHVKQVLDEVTADNQRHMSNNRDIRTMFSKKRRLNN